MLPTNTHHVLFKSFHQISHLWPLHQPFIMSILEEIVGHLKPSRTPTDAVPLRLFKEVFPSILTGLNRALDSPTFPKCLNMQWSSLWWKNQASTPQVYQTLGPRPPCLSNILDKIIYSHFLEWHNLVLESFSISCLSDLLAPQKEKSTFHRNTLQVFHVSKAWIAWKLIKILWK